MGLIAKFLLGKMKTKEKNTYAYGFRTKGKSSIIFVEEFLSNKNSRDIDETELRSLYILLAYGFEMMLKSRIILSYNSDCEKCLERELRGLSHNLKKISKKLGSAELEKIGIKGVELKEGKYENSDVGYRYYHIETADGKEVKIEDFTDIRYPAPGSGVRMVNNDEHQKILGHVKAIRYVLEKMTSTRTQ